jgi:hypothetical protein
MHISLKRGKASTWAKKGEASTDSSQGQVSVQAAVPASKDAAATAVDAGNAASIAT